MKIDLHMHTFFSDGGKSVQEIFDIARENGVKVVSITDHNNVDAYKNLDRVNRYGIKVIQGIEIDTVFEKTNIHIVMYGFDLTGTIKKYLQKAADFDRKDFLRMIKDCEKLNGIKLDKSAVKAFINDNQYFDKVRLNNLLVKLRFAPSPVEAFYKFTKIVEDKKRYQIDAKKLFKIAKKSGGQTFIAHPIKYLKDLKTVEQLEQFILELKGFGLDGVEVYNNRQTAEQEVKLLDFARKNNLKISAGSDFHGKLGAKESKQIGAVLEKNIDSKLVSNDLLKMF